MKASGSTLVEQARKENTYRGVRDTISNGSRGVNLACAASALRDRVEIYDYDLPSSVNEGS